LIGHPVGVSGRSVFVRAATIVGAAILLGAGRKGPHR
jgi:hypothetical protein